MSASINVDKNPSQGEGNSQEVDPTPQSPMSQNSNATEDAFSCKFRTFPTPTLFCMPVMQNDVLVDNNMDETQDSE